VAFALSHVQSQQAVEGKSTGEAISEQAQVHALNVLKALFRDSCLRLDVIPYLSDAIIVALDGYTSTRCACRQCWLVVAWGVGTNDR
jgi:hypothetical protein